MEAEPPAAEPEPDPEPEPPAEVEDASGTAPADDVPPPEAPPPTPPPIEEHSAEPQGPPPPVTPDPLPPNVDEPPAAENPEPEPEPAAEVPAPEPDVPAAALLGDQEVLGARVLRAGGEHVAMVDDVLVDPASGAVLGFVLQPREGTSGVPEYAAPQAVHWAASAEGPFLRLAGAPPAEADLADLFTAAGVETVRGQLEDQSEPEPAEGSLVLKIRDANNLLHRVRVAAPALVQRWIPPLTAGQEVVVEGAVTRDERGKVWIASTLALGELRVNLRDGQGALLWRDLARELTRARPLAGSERQLAADAPPARVTGWVLNHAEARVEQVLVDSGEGSRPLTWQEFAAPR